MKFIIVLVTCSITSFLFGQQRVALNSNGTSTIFSGSNPFTDAYNASNHGDTIYLPGGNIPFPTTIEKQLVIIGAGHHPDSSAVTAPTVLNGNLTLAENATGTRLEGLRLTGTLYTTTNHKIDNLSFLRARFGAVHFQGDRTTPCENVTFLECVVDGGLSLENSRQISFNNSIIGGQIYYGEELSVMNSLILYNSTSWSGSSACIQNTHNSFFANNVFHRNVYSYVVLVNSTLNTFTHNVFTSVPDAGPNTFIFSYENVDLNSFFINQSGHSFSYSHDYNLVDPSSFLGNNGTQVGVYGGAFPWKAGFIPRNPHFQFKSIPAQTDNNGQLQIEITIESQNH